MTSPVLTIEAEVPLGEARALMQRQRIHHVPVMQGSTLVGLITSREIR
jgi:CBS domain-containing protein